MDDTFHVNGGPHLKRWRERTVVATPGGEGSLTFVARFDNYRDGLTAERLEVGVCYVRPDGSWRSGRIPLSG